MAVNIPLNTATADIVEQYLTDYDKSTVVNNKISAAIAQAQLSSGVEVDLSAYATIAHVDGQDEQIMIQVTNGDNLNATNLTNHIAGDEDRWQSTLDAMVAMEARIKQWCQDLILGSTPVLDYGNPTLVMGNGGLVNLLDGQQWTAPFNGAIVCASGGLLSVAYSVLVNGSSVWESPLYALGIKIGGGESPSTEIPINAGDVVTASGLLSLGSPINVTFFANKA